ncbi:peptide-methionine (S)-S-oxide reductase MsrA [Corynebacterium heidelbergense]|uniref:Peptide methionine sulfoxide reductase MsrA n=1 Tax=Corynebacterium heidelbergense TaxID=2055947 RepID=A0A364V4G0_9CORY|nr:peptide-methionine (S)-S-oxide reductase MsrA [Corynebacterium heidelbergense]RAV31508.1 peptide-methionine (S)-S-oxide reductase [Corynebacterium heidelbergense]
MSSFLERIKALNTPGPHRGHRVTLEEALSGGRHPVLPNPQPNAVLGTPLTGPWEDDQQAIIFGLGCFWGAEKLFWGVRGVLGTSVGYAGGFTPNPTYREVCTGRTGHAEVTRIVFDPNVVTVEELLSIAFENHNPTQGDRQGNDIGTQYRSAVYATDAEQLGKVEEALGRWRPKFEDAGYGALTTEVALLEEMGDGQYYLAEEEHQQYLHKNPGGYCNHGPNGVTCQTGVL